MLRRVRVKFLPLQSTLFFYCLLTKSVADQIHQNTVPLIYKLFLAIY